ncbi:hypothetical protein V6N13_080121 [Hibiscus sabdariffa]
MRNEDSKSPTHPEFNHENIQKPPENYQENYTSYLNLTSNSRDEKVKGEIKIKRMASRVFLLEIEDILVYSSLKDSGWSYLKEVFTEVHPLKETNRGIRLKSSHYQDPGESSSAEVGIHEASLPSSRHISALFPMDVAENVENVGA